MPRNSRPIDWAKEEVDFAKILEKVAESPRIYVSLQSVIWFFLKEGKITKETSLDSLVRTIRFFSEELAAFTVEGQLVGYTTLRKIIEFLATVQKEYTLHFKEGKELQIERVERVDNVGQLREHLFHLAQTFRSLNQTKAKSSLRVESSKK